ncbi:hypothetical protein I2I11_04055 [Pontibacter sp. 172403-2]|uniref:hypothetical protein n=1 Tax=Pontibacter rufus TaxID=2791028 RepID=UPI0018AFF0F6|nr:hypothetical protein [Pontibacter sp. 172403-2]MBF9252457.1 hypothetical protein [Pontibacter sp. 172403-2]
MNYAISKFKIKQGLVVIHYSQELNEIKREHISTIHCLPHQDLMEAMDKLKVHLCFITEMVDTYMVPYLKEKTLGTAFQEDEFYEELAFARYDVTGFTLSSDGVVLIGHKTLNTKKVLNMVSPFTLLNEDSDYEYAGFLDAQLEEVLHEVNLLLNGKVGCEQLDLFEQTENAA